MQKMTSAYANKLLRSLDEEKSLWLEKEETSHSYVVANNEEPVIPEYDYTEVSERIAQLDEKIAIIKHAINLSNATASVMVGEETMSIDLILIKMAQLNRRKLFLNRLRMMLPKAREGQTYASRNAVPEYRYINFDLELVKKEFERVSQRIMELQMALDLYNQTVQFEVDLP